ncbi:MAG: helix-turn-helix domain-containing protein [Ramlibacter sp.]
MTNAVPQPGRPVRGSRTGRPVMALLDLLGRRGSLRLLWELRDGHPQSFRLLRASADGISPSVLNTRLKELREARLVALGEDGYLLTGQGVQLVKSLQPLNRWAEAWAAQSQPGGEPPQAGQRPPGGQRTT